MFQFEMEQSAELEVSRQKLARECSSDSDDFRSHSKFRQLDDLSNRQLKLKKVNPGA